MLKNKKLIILLIIFFLLFSISKPAFADEEDDDEIIDSSQLQDLISLETSSPTLSDPTLNAKSAIIYDRTSKKIIWGKDENTKKAMASTTKIMTAIVVIENSNLSDIVTVSKKAASIGGSKLKLNENDKIAVNDLLYGLMLRSR